MIKRQRQKQQNCKNERNVATCMININDNNDNGSFKRLFLKALSTLQDYEGGGGTG